MAFEGGKLETCENQDALTLGFVLYTCQPFAENSSKRMLLWRQATPMFGRSQHLVCLRNRQVPYLDLQSTQNNGLETLSFGIKAMILSTTMEV